MNKHVHRFIAFATLLQLFALRSFITGRKKENKFTRFSYCRAASI